jgi:hypothetical protein
MATSRYFNGKPGREHLTRQGVGSEIRDLRQDVETAFVQIEAEAGVPVLANIAALSALSDTSLVTGSRCRVLTVDSDFILDKSNATAADGITIVTTASGVGRWVRMASTSTKFLNSRTWYIDPAAGNDENNGTTNLTPLKTCKELNRRVWAYTNGGRYLVQYLSAPVAGDPPMYNGSFSPQFYGNHNKAVSNANFIFKGAYTSTGVTGTVTASTTVDSTANTCWSITDASVTWASHLRNGHHIRFTSGNCNGMFAIPMTDLGAGRVIITHPVSWDTTLAGDAVSLSADVVPSVGSTFEIVTFMNCPELDLSQQFSNHYVLPTYQWFNFLGSDLTGSPNQGQKIYSRAEFVHCSVNFNLIIQNPVTAGQFVGIATSFNGPTNAAWYCLQVPNQGLVNLLYCGMFGYVFAGSWSKIIAQRTNFNNLVQLDLASELALQVSAFFQGPSALSYAVQALQESKIYISTTTKIIGQNATTLFDISQGATVRLYASDLTSGNYSFVSTGPIMKFNGFGYAYPPPQPVSGPVAQVLTALPTTTNLTAMNAAPWKLPSVLSQMPVCIVATSPDTTTKFVAN